MKKYKKGVKKKYVDPYDEVRKDRAFLKAFRNGFDERYCSSKVKKFTAEEIVEYEREKEMNLS